MNVALLPSKPLALAKTRLGAVLAPADRSAIGRAMFADVLQALREAPSLDAIVVITADPTLEALARSAGALLVDEGPARGLNAAMARGTGAARHLGATVSITVLSDVPLITAADVEELVARTPPNGAVVVPCKDGTGTNAIVRRPPELVGPCFGGRSLERHVAAAERQGIPCEIVRNARVSFDVDTVADLRAFAAHESPTATYREALRLGLAPLRPVV